MTCRNTKKQTLTYTHTLTYAYIKLHLDFPETPHLNIHTAFRFSCVVAYIKHTWLNGGYDGWRMYGGEVGFREHTRPFSYTPAKDAKLSGRTCVRGICTVHVRLEEHVSGDCLCKTLGASCTSWSFTRL